jgi:hypothetical protein
MFYIAFTMVRETVLSLKYRDNINANHNKSPIPTMHNIPKADAARLQLHKGTDVPLRN